MVSVLFSEPKIPQLGLYNALLAVEERFSALQRAENSSIFEYASLDEAAQRFQCSSASRKFLNCTSVYRVAPISSGFSALQRAENSSISSGCLRFCTTRAGFSALQRAENSSIVSAALPAAARGGFSALQRAENSSIRLRTRARRVTMRCFSALQRAENSSIRRPSHLRPSIFPTAMITLRHS